MFCTKCGSANDDKANFCVKCGYALPLQGQEFAKSQAQADVAVSDEEFYKAVVGLKNQDYYLERFSRFDNDGETSATWHWSAFLVTFYWLLYRKMWRNAVLYFFLPYAFFILIGIAGAVMGDAAGLAVGIAYLAYLAGIFILLPMYANAYYYKHCKKVIATVRASSHDTQRQLGELSGKGGTSSIVIILLLIFTFVAFIGILAAVAIPAYQDYTTKARMTQGVIIGQEATESVSSFYGQYRAIPPSLEAAGFAATLPPAINGVSIDSQTGTISITMAGGAVDGKSLLFVPSLDADDQIGWTCKSEEIQDRYLPQDCRQAK
jgi:type II secretory pathway pseudopilin PulG